VSRSPPNNLWSAPSPLVASDREFEVAEGEISAQTDLEKFLQYPTTDTNDDQRKPVESKESPEYLASSLTAEEAENLLRTYAYGSKYDQKKPAEAEDPLVSLVTQEGPLPKEDLIKKFPEAYPSTASKDPKVNPPHDDIGEFTTFVNANDTDHAICPTPSSPAERTQRRGKRKQSNNDEFINSKSPKLASRSTVWRAGKGIKIKEEEEKLKSLKAENGELVERITCLFGALAHKNGKLERLVAFKDHYLKKHFLDFFYLDQKVKDLSKQLQDSQNTKRDRKAKYLEELMESTKFHEKILAMRKRVLEKLSFDINNNLK